MGDMGTLLCLCVSYNTQGGLYIRNVSYMCKRNGVARFSGARGGAFLHKNKRSDVSIKTNENRCQDKPEKSYKLPSWAKSKRLLQGMTIAVPWKATMTLRQQSDDNVMEVEYWYSKVKCSLLCKTIRPRCVPLSSCWTKWRWSFFQIRVPLPTVHCILQSKNKLSNVIFNSVMYSCPIWNFIIWSK